MTELISRVKTSVYHAHIGKSRLTGDILSLEGMSSNLVRHFLNNLCSFRTTNYLEIGCWKGSTFISALYGNNNSVNSAVTIDDWSDFGGPRYEFHSNVNKYISNVPHKILESDCFRTDLSVFQYPINVYFYDGDHTEEAQEKAFTYFNPIFADTFIAIVDDWNAEEVRKGTSSAFKKLNYKILFEEQFFTTKNGDTNSWWNGLYIAVIDKNKNLTN